VHQPGDNAGPGAVVTGRAPEIDMVHLHHRTTEDEMAEHDVTLLTRFRCHQTQEFHLATGDH